MKGRDIFSFFNPAEDYEKTQKVVQMLEQERNRKVIIHLSTDMARGTNIKLYRNAHVNIAFTCRSYAEYE